MLKRLPGPGVHAVRPDTSISQSAGMSVAVPGSRQLMPMMAIGSMGPCPAASGETPRLLLLEPPCLLTTDQGVEMADGEELSLDSATLLSRDMAGLCASWSMFSVVFDNSASLTRHRLKKERRKKNQRVARLRAGSDPAGSNGPVVCARDAVKLRQKTRGDSAQWPNMTALRSGLGFLTVDRKFVSGARGPCK